VLTNERLELVDELDTCAEREIGFGPVFEGEKMELFEPIRLQAQRAVVANVGKRRAAPERQCAREDEERQADGNDERPDRLGEHAHQKGQAERHHEATHPILRTVGPSDEAGNQERGDDHEEAGDVVGRRAGRRGVPDARQRDERRRGNRQEPYPPIGPWRHLRMVPRLHRAS
jgi:hypothetical protein